MREIIHTKRAPSPIGPYSQAVRANGFIFVSGQIPIDPASGEIVAGDIVAQTHQVLRNLKAVLESAGSSLAKVVKTTVFVADLGDFALLNQVYGDLPGQLCFPCLIRHLYPQGI